MIKFIFGTNSHLIQQKLHEIEADFLKSDAAGINLEKIDGADLTASKFIQAISAMPFLAPRRLVIVRDFLAQNKDEKVQNKIQDVISSGTSSELADIVFVEMGQPDKRTKMYKFLLKNGEVTEARPLEGGDVARFVRDELSRAGTEATPAVMEHLILCAGNGPQRISSEIAKLSLYAKAQGRNRLEKGDIDLLVVAETDPNVFAFTEALVRKDARRAARLLGELLSNGENEQKLLGTMAYQFRTLIIIKDALERGMDGRQLATQAKLSPYVVNKNMPIAKAKTMRSLVQMYESLRRTDAIAKTSAIPADLALNILVATLCR